MKKQSKMLPPTYFYSILILEIIIHFIIPISIIIKQPASFFGLPLIIIGLILNLWTDSQFKKKHTTVKPYETPSSLIKDGPYKISRNPMYLGMLFILIGIAVFLGSIIIFLFPILFIVIMEILFIPTEEQVMWEQFQKEYDDYRRKVRRWI